MRRAIIAWCIVAGVVTACSADDSSSTTNDAGTTTGNDGGNTTKDSGSASDTGSIVDTGTLDTGFDAGVFRCAATACSLPSSCCIAPEIDAGFAAACTDDAGSCDTSSALLQCASAADCVTGDVCCINGNVEPITATCMSSSACPVGGDQAWLCDPSASEASNQCGDAGACGNTKLHGWRVPPSYGTCGDQRYVF